MNVTIFYSSKIEQDLEKFYKKDIEYLRKKKIKTNIIDVTKDPELAEENNVIATPLVIIKTNGVEKRYVGLAGCIEELVKLQISGDPAVDILDYINGKPIPPRNI